MAVTGKIDRKYMAHYIDVEDLHRNMSVLERIWKSTM